MKCEYNSDNEMIQHLVDSMPMDEYEGLSFKEIHYLIYDPYNQNSPMFLAESIDTDILFKIPFFNLVKYFLDLVKETQPIKTNANGYLPLRVVQQVYDLHFIAEDLDDVRDTKIIRRSQSLAVKNVRIITDLAGLTISDQRKFELTQKGEEFKSISNGAKLFSEIIKTYTSKFKWSFNDNYGSNNIGQFGFAYILILVSKYGDTPRNLSFYLDKYYKAFNSVLYDSENHEYHKDLYRKCIVLRTFARFLNWFGLISMVTLNSSLGEHIIEKSEIFDSLIRFE